MRFARNCVRIARKWYGNHLFSPTGRKLRAQGDQGRGGWLRFDDTTHESMFTASVGVVRRVRCGRSPPTVAVTGLFGFCFLGEGEGVLA